MVVHTSIFYVQECVTIQHSQYSWQGVKKYDGCVVSYGMIYISALLKSANCWKINSACKYHKHCPTCNLNVWTIAYCWFTEKKGGQFSRYKLDTGGQQVILDIFKLEHIHYSTITCDISFFSLIFSLLSCLKERFRLLWSPCCLTVLILYLWRTSQPYTS
jgi:hypothetical protein